MKKWLLQVGFRVIMGLLGIFIINSLCSYFGNFVLLGINGWNLLTIGTLGIPGFGLLCAISLFTFL